jgi:hypothetical protein
MDDNDGCDLACFPETTMFLVLLLLLLLLPYFHIKNKEKSDILVCP